MIHPHKKSPTLIRILKMSRDVVGSAEYIVPSLEKQVKGVSTPPPIWYWVTCREKHMDVQPLIHWLLQIGSLFLTVYSWRLIKRLKKYQKYPGVERYNEIERADESLSIHWPVRKLMS